VAARRIVVFAALALMAGCRAGAVGGAAPGAASSEAVVREFLNAARAQDLQALSAVWGNEDSPTRDRIERQELERRLLIMMCHLRHDESRILEAQAGEAGRTVRPVELTQSAQKVSTTFTLVKNRRSGRWFVEDFDMRPLVGLCTRPSGRSD
jgi:hypothetical protein